MKIAYFDCFSGISGDMVLGALIDAGLPPARLQEQIDRLGLQGVRLDIQRTSRHGIAATRVRVLVGGAEVSLEHEYHLEPATDLHHHRGEAAAGDQGHSHAHHHLEDLLSRLARSDLEPELKQTASRVFQRLAEAEALVHGTSVDQVHLHEVGALDALVDIVGAVAGLRLLGVDEVHASPLRFGTGFAHCAHGRYPVPVPGVLALCQGVPVEQTQIRAELVTPTGAAIITTLARSFGSPPPFRQQAVGYGAGSRDLEEIPNLLRLRLGESSAALKGDRLVLIEANIDDMNPQVYGYLFDLLLEQGARDVYLTPVHMKKGRPGSLLSVLADEESFELLAALVLAETTTIGVRYHPVERRKLERQIRTVDTPYGPVRLKVCDLDGRRRASPEYDDCARLARQHQVPILAVYEAARRAFSEE
jgi:uncharacterized protein (TIGR00299 family) protein